jgi:hypothetical protein
MPLNSSGPISLGGATTGQSINLELGQSATAQISLNDTNVRTLAGVASGAISLNSFYGKAADLTYAFLLGETEGGNTGTDIDRVNFTTLTLSLSGLSAAFYTDGPDRLSSSSVCLMFSNLGTSNKSTSIRGVMMYTQTTFVAGVSSPDNRANAACMRAPTTGATGYRLNGINQDNAAVSNTLRYNMSTYSSTAISASAIGGSSVFARAGSESLSFGQFLVDTQVSPFVARSRFTFSNETTSAGSFDSSTFQNNGSITAIHRSKTACYWLTNASASPTYSVKANFATNTSTPGPLPSINRWSPHYDFNQGSYPFVSNGLYSFAKAGYYVSGNRGLNYTLGLYINYTNDAWTVGVANPSGTVTDRFGAEQYTAPTA